MKNTNTQIFDILVSEIHHMRHNNFTECETNYSFAIKIKSVAQRNDYTVKWYLHGTLNYEMIVWKRGYLIECCRHCLVVALSSFPVNFPLGEGRLGQNLWK